MRPTATRPGTTAAVPTGPDRPPREPPDDGPPGRPRPSRVGRRRRSRRWIRAVAPFVVWLVFWAFTGLAHAVDEPDLADAGTLSPTGTGPDGSSELAAGLAARGVRIETVTSSRDAITAAQWHDVTLFVPTPDFLNAELYSFVDNVPGRHRVVIVEPGLRTALFWRAPIFPASERWATKAVPPGCATPYAVEAGRAAVLRTRYEVFDARADASCYGGGLVGVKDGDTEIIVVGATDPFRNGRIGEHGNAALAMALLGERNHVVWVDVHQREPVPRFPVGQLPYERGERNRGGDSLFNAFPSALWATLVAALAAALLFALARSRRLGGPVAEPLPVLVPSAEAVTGRGRLYERVRARDATLEALRTAAIARINRVLNPFGGAAAERDLTGHAIAGTTPAAEQLIARLAERTGQPVHAIRAILYGPPPDDDGDLRRAVEQLDALVNAVVRDVPPVSPTPPEHPEQPAPQPHQGGTP